MRPGQAAPDEQEVAARDFLVCAASMRPGQAAPDENCAIPTTVGMPAASMRPGQAAPDEHPPIRPPRWKQCGFNEAGASSPG